MGYVQVFRQRTRPEAKTVRVSAQRQGMNLRHRPLHIGFYIGSDVARELGWNPRCRLNLFWGTEKSSGQARLERSESGSFTLQKRSRGGNGSLYIKTAQLPPNAKGVVDPIRAEPVKFIILNNGLEITLPDWLCPKPEPVYVKKQPEKNLGRPRKDANKDKNNDPHNEQQSIHSKQNGHLTA